MSMLLRRHYAENKATGAIANKAVAPKPTPKVAEPKVVPNITAKEIKAMTGAKLRKLAKEFGVENPEELTVGELKAVMCDKVG